MRNQARRCTECHRRLDDDTFGTFCSPSCEQDWAIRQLAEQDDEDDTDDTP